MKILIFNWRCWLNPESGGAEVFTHEVAKRWVKNGHEVTLFTSEFPSSKREEISDGIKIVRSGRKYSVYGNAKKYYSNRFAKEHFDIVIDEINTRPFFAPKFVKNGEKVIALIHQLAREFWFYETRFPINYLGHHFFENRWLKNYINVPTITVSESTKSDLINLGFNQLFIVPEGLNFEPQTTLSQKSLNPVVIYVGRLKPAKRPDHAIRAFQIVKQKIPEAELWIVGDGYFRSDLEDLPREGVRFFGRVSTTERNELIRKAWVLVNPSVREGWGLNIIEANALGTPCVVYDVAGLRDSVLNLETGLLAAPGNIDDLAEKLILALSDENLRQFLSLNALKNAQQFNWEKTEQEFAKIFEHLLQGTNKMVC